MRRLGFLLVLAVLAAAVFAPVLSPNGATEEFRDLLHAPPTAVHLRNGDGSWTRPFVHPWRVESRLEQRFTVDRASRAELVWLSEGRLIGTARGGAPLLVLGADAFGRDVFARLLYGARTSLSVALAGALGALLIGVLVGAVAGYAGGLADEALMRASELVLVLPLMYVVLSLRAVMPLVLPPPTIFLLMTAVLALVGWPSVARGVRATIRSERALDYAAAAVASGAGPARVLWRHLLPASRGFLATQLSVLVPAFILAEATLSFVGLGFPDPVPTWGTMLQEAASVVSMTEFPWTLAPAAAIFVVVLGFNLILQDDPRAELR
jgi:peptide/nickel transport system permease protein